MTATPSSRKNWNPGPFFQIQNERQRCSSGEGGDSQVAVVVRTNQGDDTKRKGSKIDILLFRLLDPGLIKSHTEHKYDVEGMYWRGNCSKLCTEKIILNPNSASHIIFICVPWPPNPITKYVNRDEFVDVWRERRTVNAVVVTIATFPRRSVSSLQYIIWSGNQGRILPLNTWWLGFQEDCKERVRNVDQLITPPLRPPVPSPPLRCVTGEVWRLVVTALIMTPPITTAHADDDTRPTEVVEGHPGGRSVGLFHFYRHGTVFSFAHINFLAIVTYSS